MPGKYNPYDMVSPSVKQSKSACYVDFSALETHQVTLVHHDNGALVRQVVQDGELKPMPPPVPIGSMRTFSLVPEAASPHTWIQAAAMENIDEAPSTTESSVLGIFTPASSLRLRDDD